MKRKKRASKGAGLGSLLVRSFSKRAAQRSSERKASARASSRKRSRADRARGSVLQVILELPSKSRALVPLTLRPVDTPTLPAPEVPALQTQPVLPAPAALAPAVQVLERESRRHEEARRDQALSVERLIRPDDALKQSIEAFLLDQRSEHTRRAYGRDLKRFVQFLLHKKFAGDVGRIDRALIVGYKDSLVAEGLQHTTVDRHLATLRSFFKWLADDGLIHESPAARVRFINPRRLSTTVGFTDAEVRKVLAQPDLHRRTGALHYAILMVLFYCGLRRSEICELKMSQLLLERDHHILKLRGKGNAERIVVLVPAVWNALLYYFRITGRSPVHKEDFLFRPIKNNRTGNTDRPLDPSMIFYIVKRYAKLAGIESRVSPHSCRATAISNARDHQVPDRAIQEFAGWASTSMITRYDKRRSSIEQSAAHSILYGGDEGRLMPIDPTSAPREAEPEAEEPTA